MGVNMEFDLSNIEEELNKMVDDIEAAEKRIILKSTQLVRERMRQRVRVSKIKDPEYTHIKDNMQMSGLKDDGEGTKYREIRGGRKTGYKWKFLEFGTVKMKAIPFMQPSVEDTEKEREMIAYKELKKVIEN